MDDAVLAVWRGARPTATTTPDEGVPADNPKAVRQLVRGVLAQKRAAAALKRPTKEA
jgi:hypothetical protein